MPRAIDSAVLTSLRWLDQRGDELRKELGLHQRHEIITWYMSETDPQRFFEVVADGYGKFTLIDYRGINPNDRDFLNETEYDDEETACRAARRLGEFGVDWVERDKELKDFEDEDAPESD